MQSTEKLRLERAIFDSVYDAGEYSEVSHEDSPDFIVRRGHTERFGVEITELFPDESVARMLKVPNYMKKLWGGGDPIHRDDFEGLKVAHVQVSDRDGNVKATDVPVIMRPAISEQSHYDKLAEAIERKSESFKHYQRELTHINLVVADYFDSGSSIAKEYSTGEFLTPRLRNALRLTPFRSVILVSHAGYQNSVWRPLDMLWLWEAFMVYLETLGQFEEAMDLLDPLDVALEFHAAMLRLGEPVELRTEDGIDFVSGGGFSIAYKSEGVVLHDYANWPAPGAKGSPSDTKLPTELQNAVVAKFVELRETSGLVSEFSMPVRPSAEAR